MAILTPGPMISRYAAGMASNSCLVEVRNTMIRYGCVIDSGHCIGCHNCFLACRDEHAGNDYLVCSGAMPALRRRALHGRQ